MLFHRYLSGEEPQVYQQPFEHFLGRICEEFHCLPSDAWDEWQRLPTGTIEQIIEYRQYAAAKLVYDVNPKAEGDMIQIVELTEFAIVQADRDADGV